MKEERSLIGSSDSESEEVCATTPEPKSNPLSRDMVALALIQTLIGASLMVVPILLVVGAENLHRTFPRWPPIAGGMTLFLAASGVVLVVAGYMRWPGRSRWLATLLVGIVVVSSLTVGLVLSVVWILVFDAGRRTFWILAVSGVGVALFAAGLGLLRRRRWARSLQRWLSFAGAITSGLAGLGLISLAASAPWIDERIISLVGSAYCICTGVAFLLVARSLSPRHADDYTSDRLRTIGVVGIRALIASLMCFWMITTLIVSTNIVNAWQRDRQKTTVGMMYQIAAATDAYAADHKEYPSASTIEDLAGLLVPEYIVELPTVDGWGWPFEYHKVDHGFVVRSPGSDGRFEQSDPTAYAGGPVEGFERDIVWSRVSQIQFPSGLMSF